MSGNWIVIDHRERRAGLAAELLGEDSGFRVRWDRLVLGDYLIDGRLLIERKSLLDLCKSIKHGRLFSQAQRMAELLRCNRRRVFRAGRTNRVAHDACLGAEPDRTALPVSAALKSVQACALLVEGTSRDMSESRMPLPSIRAALATVSMLIGVPVLRSGSASESAQLLSSLAGQLSSVSNAALPRMGVRPTGKRGLQLHLLQGLPGVGPRRAARLLERFGSVRDVLNAGDRDLAGVKGIGPDTAGRIGWAVGEDHARYGASWSASERNPELYSGSNAR